jgi:8-oxo-dGTP diphosphatase
MWEFPGGKIAPLETPIAAVRRELAEEVGIFRAQAVHPWITIEHRYPHGEVTLHFFRVVNPSGEPAGREGQILAWRNLRLPPPRNLLAANRRPWKWLSFLPPLCAISDTEAIGIDEFLRRLKSTLAGGLRFFILRDKNLPPPSRADVAECACALCRKSGALFIVADDAALARRLKADGVHLGAENLLRAAHRPRFKWVGASAHNDAELKKAAALGLDYALLSPVKKTASHPSAKPLGWRGFAALAKCRPLPVFALGGLTPADIPRARRNAAHGVAAIRGVWR